LVRARLRISAEVCISSDSGRGATPWRGRDAVLVGTVGGTNAGVASGARAARAVIVAGDQGLGEGSTGATRSAGTPVRVARILRPEKPECSRSPLLGAKLPP
jgi:hypothetical protein